MAHEYISLALVILGAGIISVLFLLAHWEQGANPPLAEGADSTAH